MAPTSTPIPEPERTHIGGDGSTSILQIILLTLGIIALVITSLIVIGLFMVWYVEYRGLGGLNLVERAYARMAIYGRWIGVRLVESSTPDERRRTLVDEVPTGAPPINAITHAYIEDRYADPGVAHSRAETNDSIAEQAWSDARWTFIRHKLAQWLRRVSHH
jgi:hypothetical protein